MKQSKKKLVLFDIDGTLIKGDHPVAGASIPYAIKKVFNLEKIVVDWEKYYGGTDRGITTSVAINHGKKREEVNKRIEEVAFARFEYFSQNITPDYKERVLPGAREILEVLKSWEGIILGLLTGNFEKVGWHKLELVALEKYFEFGVFGDIAENRTELAKQVFRQTREKLEIEFKPKGIIVIGDTPRDVECAHAIGAKVIAVTTGAFGKKELKGADLIVDSLKDKRILKFIKGKI